MMRVFIRYLQPSAAGPPALFLTQMINHSQRTYFLTGGQ